MGRVIQELGECKAMSVCEIVVLVVFFFLEDSELRTLL